ncbi:metallopeptidase [Synechococcus sp. A15-127]|nr:metallopeptidase [Synechococcus sp. A15-127]
MFDGDDENNNVTATLKNYKRMNIYSAVQQVERMFVAPTDGGDKITYYFTFTYSNGDSYKGYGYATGADAIYAEGLTPDANNSVTITDVALTDSQGTAGTGTGTYEIHSIVNGAEGEVGRVELTAYDDVDTEHGNAIQVYGFGTSGLGSEKGDAFGEDGSEGTFDSGFTNKDEADLVENAYLDIQKYGFVYRYSSKANYTVDENVTLAAQLSGSDNNFTIVGGADQERFTLETIQIGDESFGVLNFKEQPNFEQANDSGADNTYKVNIRSNEIATINGAQTEIGVIQEVTINVKDINESPTFLDSTINQDTTDKDLYKVSEGTTTVTTLLASDPDAADQNALSFRIVNDSSATDTAAGLFQIDEATGELSLINPPDYEALKENGNWIFDLTIEVQDNGGPDNELDASGQPITLSNRRQIQVEITDVDEHDVAFLDPADNGSVAENSPGGTEVGITANAIDNDGTNNTITYSLSDALDGALFTINPISGVVTVKNADGIDFETAQSHTIEVVAQSSDGSIDKREFTIDVENVIEALPFFNSSATRNLNEGTTTVTTSDDFVAGQAITDPESQGPYTYSITGGADQNLFSVDAGNGSLSFVAAPDFEGPSDADTNNVYSVELTASNGAGTSTAKQILTIRVSDVNESAVSAPVDSNATDNALNENAPSGTTTGIQASSTDADGTNNGVTYSIVDAQGDAPANTFGINPNTGIISVQVPDVLNFEANSSVTVTVRATSEDGSTADKQFSIPLNNINEEFELSSATNFSINEGSNRTVGQLTAVDHDGTTDFNYNLVGANSGDANFFNIDASTGVLSFKIDPDYESLASQSRPHFQFQVTASDVVPTGASGEPFIKTIDVQVDINDVVERTTTLPGFLSGDSAQTQANSIDSELYTGHGYAQVVDRTPLYTLNQQVVGDHGVYTITSVQTLKRDADEVEKLDNNVFIDKYYDFQVSHDILDASGNTITPAGTKLSSDDSNLDADATAAFAIHTLGSGNNGLGSETGEAYNFFQNNPNYAFSPELQADVVGSSPTDYAFYTFTYYYGDGTGDFYTGYGFTHEGSFGLSTQEQNNNLYGNWKAIQNGRADDAGTTDVDESRELKYTANNEGYYIIDSVFANAPLDDSALGLVGIDEYFDADFLNREAGDTQAGVYARDVIGYGEASLGSEAGQIVDYDDVSFDVYFGNTATLNSTFDGWTDMRWDWSTDGVHYDLSLQTQEANLDYRGTDQDTTTHEANDLGSLTIDTTAVTTKELTGSSATHVINTDGFAGNWMGRDRLITSENTPNAELFGGWIPEDIDLFKFVVDSSGVNFAAIDNSGELVDGADPVQAKGARVTIETSFLKNDAGEVVNPSVDTILRLFNAYGEQIGYDDDSGTLPFQSKINARLADGEYYLGVSGYDNDGYNPLREENAIDADTGRYVLNISTAPLREIEAQDRNGTLATARFAADPTTGEGALDIINSASFKNGFDVPVWIGTDPIDYSVTGDAASNWYTVGQKDVDMITFEIPSEARAGVKTPITILTSPKASPMAYVEAYEVNGGTLTAAISSPANMVDTLKANTQHYLLFDFNRENVSNFDLSDIVLFDGSAISDAIGTFDTSYLAAVNSSYQVTADGTADNTTTANMFAVKFTPVQEMAFDPGKDRRDTSFRIRAADGNTDVGVIGAFDMDADMDGFYDAEIDTVLRLFNADPSSETYGNELAVNDDYGHDVYSRLDLNLDPGIYAVAVSGYGNEEYKAVPADTTGADGSPDGTVDGYDAAAATDRFRGSTGITQLHVIVNTNVQSDPNGTLINADTIELTPGNSLSLNESFGTDLNREDGTTRNVLLVDDVDLYTLNATTDGRLLIDIDAVADSNEKTKATMLRFFNSRGEEIASDTAGSYAQDIAGNVTESTEADHKGSHLNVEVLEDQTYYIGVSQLEGQQDYEPTSINGRSVNTVNEGSYQIHIDYQPNFSSLELDADGYIGATSITDIDLSSNNFTGAGTIGDDITTNDLLVGPSDIDYFRVFFDRNGEGNATSTNSRILSVEAKGVEATERLDVALDLYTMNDAGSEYLRVNGNDNQGDVSITDPNDENRDAHFSASINPGTEYFLAVRGSGNEIVNPENLSHSVAGSTGAYTLTASLAAAVTGRGNSTLTGFLNNSVSYDGSDLSTLQGSTFDLDLIADSLESTGITTGEDNTAVELDSPVVPTTGLIFEGEIGVDGGENAHPFADLYRAELGLDDDAPVRSDFVGADDIDLFRFSIAQAGSYELSTKILGDSTQQADPDIRLFKADGTELTSSASLEHPSQGLTEQLVIQLAAGDYIAMLSGEGAATGQKLKIDTNASTDGSQPGFDGSLTEAEYIELGRNMGEYEFKVRQAVLETTEAEQRGTTAGFNLNIPVNIGGLRVAGNSKSVFLVRTVNGVETEIPGSVHKDAVTSRLSFVPSDPAEMAQPGQYDFRIRKGHLQGLNADGSLAMDPSTGNALVGSVSGSLQLTTDDTVESTTIQTVTNESRLVYLPSFTRAPGQEVNLEGGDGIPVYITDTTDLRELSVTMHFDPGSLTIASSNTITLASDLTDAGWSVSSTDLDQSNGRLTVTLTGSSELTAIEDDRELFRIDANVPMNSTFRSEELFGVEASGRKDTGAPLDIMGSSALMKIAIMGDNDGDGEIKVGDAITVLRNIVGLDEGFTGYSYTDPTIIGDTDGSGALSVGDAIQGLRTIVGLENSESMQVNDYVSDSIAQLAGEGASPIDPIVRIGSTTVASVVDAAEDLSISLPVDITLLEEGVTAITGLDIKVNYDPTILNFVDDGTSTEIELLTVNVPNFNAVGTLSGDNKAGWLVDPGTAFSGDGVSKLTTGAAAAIENGTSGVISVAMASTTGITIDDPTAITTDNPLTIGTLLIKIPKGTADQIFDFDLKIDEVTITGLVGGNATELTTTDVIDGVVTLGDAVAPDTTPPTITIASDDASLTIGETAGISFTLSEAATDFTVDDVVVTGGALSDFAGSGTAYTATFTPTANSTTDGVVSVAAGAFKDAADNASTGDASVSMTVDTRDTTPPTVAITTNSSELSVGDTATITFTLSEASTDFTVDDVTATGGSISNFSGSGTSYAAMFTPTPESTTTGVVSVAPGAFKDAADNASTGDASVSMTVNTVVPDTAAPTVAITTSDDALTTNERATITFTLSEDSADFTEDDVTVSGGSLSSFSGEGTTYTATFTPTDDSVADGVVSIDAGKFTDAAGNANTAGSVTMSVNTDITAPTIAITTNVNSLGIGETANISFTLSETSTNFAFEDITVAGGALSEFDGSGNSYTATFTPTVNSDDDGVVSVDAEKFTDAAGNPNTARSITLSVDTTDTTPPSVAITADDQELTIGETANITFTFSEPIQSESPKNFELEDILVTGGSISQLSGENLTYTALFTPEANSTTAGVITVPVGRYNDITGNVNNTPQNIIININTLIPPTITINHDLNDVNLDASQIAIQFVQSVPTDFKLEHVSVTGGALTLQDATTADQLIRYGTFTPSVNNVSGDTTITIPANSFKDENNTFNNVEISKAIENDIPTPPTTPSTPTETSTTPSTPSASSQTPPVTTSTGEPAIGTTPQGAAIKAPTSNASEAAKAAVKNIKTSSDIAVQATDKGVVATTTGGSKVTVKAEIADKVEIAEDNTGRLTLKATEKVEDVEIVANKPDLKIDGSKIKNSTFVFEEGVTANLVSTSKVLNNASFTMQEGKDKATFESGTLKNSTVDTGAGGDDIVIGADATVKKATFDLGSGKDEVVIEGKVKKAEFNMGDDNQKDKIQIDSLENIKKKLTIDNFGKRDKLVVEGDKYGYKALQELDGSLGKIEINFQDEENNSSSDIVSGFDFL